MSLRVILLVAATAVAALFSAGFAYADDYRSVENAGPQEVVDAMASKAARGVANTVTGWAEFPKQIYITAKDDGIAKGLVIGPLKGIGMTLVRTASGLLEAVTFFVPYPGFFDPYFDPSYVWQKE